LGRPAFVATLLGVLVKLVLLLFIKDDGAVYGIGLLCALLPALPAILVDIRAYSEFELSADQSAAMQHVMADASEQMDTLEKLDFDRPLASRELGVALFELGVALFNVKMTMLLDVKGGRNYSA
jgi:hypothetical protein